MTELLSALSNLTATNYDGARVESVRLDLDSLSEEFKEKRIQLNLTGANKEAKMELLDALADGVVTSVGVAYMAGFQFPEALEEVNSSNFSKFVEGKPIFSPQGKILKGPEYHKPLLHPYV